MRLTPFARRQTQIAYTMAATNKTPTVSIKISASSKPAIVRAFDMVPPSRLYAAINQPRSDHVEVVIERIREDAPQPYKLMKCSGQRYARAQDLRHG